MAKPSGDFVRYLAALIAVLLGVALSASSIADEFPPSALVPTATNDLAVNDVATDAETRLSAVEKQLAEMIATKKQAEAGTPTFRMGGMVQVDYLWIGQTSANRATVGDAD